MADHTTNPGDLEKNTTDRTASTQDEGSENFGDDLFVKTIILPSRHGDDSGSNADDKGENVPEMLGPSTAHYAIVHYKTACDDSGTEFKNMALVIQARILQRLVRNVLGYLGKKIGSSGLLLMGAPFCEFDTHWGHFQDEAKRLMESNPEDASLLQRFSHWVTNVLQPGRDRRRAYFEHIKVSFDGLDRVYRPDSTVLEIRDYGIRGFYVLQGRYEEWNSGKVFVLECKFFANYLGQQGWYSRVLIFPRFEGRKPLFEMPLYPLEACKYPSDVEQQLVRQTFNLGASRLFQLANYDGTAVHWSTHTPEIVSGQFVMDWMNCPRDCPDYRMFLRPRRESLDAAALSAASDSPDQLFPWYRPSPISENSSPSSGGSSWSPPSTPRLLSSPPPSSPSPSSSSSSSSSASASASASGLSAEQKYALLHVNPWFPGYSLQHRKWFMFHANHFERARANSNAVASLVIPEHAKKSLTDLFKRDEDTDDDADEDADEDVEEDVDEEQELETKAIILSSQFNESGKSAAKAVADEAGSALYRLDALELGQSPDGETLGTTFATISKWKAFLLVENCHGFEADSEKWNTFRKSLENFRGCAFFSGNGIRNFDPGFENQSVVDLD